MDHRKRRAVFSVDGHEISATFADSRNTAVLGHVKQILLSSFANNLTDKTSGDSLALKAKLSDNNSGVLIRSFKAHWTYRKDRSIYERKSLLFIQSFHRQAGGL